MPDRDDMAVMLARQVLGHRDYDLERVKPNSATGDPRLARGQVEVELRLQSMVHNIVQQTWIDSAAIAQNVEARVREAASEANIEAEIARAVTAELGRMRHEITRLVQEKVARLIEHGIDNAVGNAPATLANKIARRMWDAVFKETAPRKGTRSYSAARERKRR